VDEIVKIKYTTAQLIRNKLFFERCEERWIGRYDFEQEIVQI
jgi:hypothetical protein